MLSSFSKIWNTPKEVKRTERQIHARKKRGTSLHFVVKPKQKKFKEKKRKKALQKLKKKKK